jgi:hypothetical protein
MFITHSERFFHHHMNPQGRAIANGFQMVINGIESGYSLWPGCCYHGFQGIKHKVHAKSMLLAELQGQFPVGFHDTHNFDISPLFPSEDPVHMCMNQSNNPYTKWFHRLRAAVRFAGIFRDQHVRRTGL